MKRVWTRAVLLRHKYLQRKDYRLRKQMADATSQSERERIWEEREKLLIEIDALEQLGRLDW